MSENLREKDLKITEKQDKLYRTQKIKLSLY